MFYEIKEAAVKIAQIAPLWETVPPQTYGGTELVVANLARELAKKGHQVTLFGIPHPDTPLEGIRVECNIDTPLRSRGFTSGDALYYELQLLEMIFSKASEFDVIHNHLGYQALAFASLSNTPVLTTLHGIFEPAPFKECIQSFRHLPYVSISDYQRKPCSNLNYVSTVYHGIRVDQYTYDTDAENKKYLAFLGRFSPEKGAHHAILLAQETGWPLVLAGKIVDEFQHYFDTQIQPHLDGDQIRYIGEVNLAEKNDLLKNAAATLCPIEWAEPFGLVLIESLACGTPVLSLRNGSVPELIEDGVTGLISNNYDELKTSLKKLSTLSRIECRRQAETRFCASRMAEDYLRIYHQISRNKVLKPQFAKEKIPTQYFPLSGGVA